ncbi:MAG: Bug family tripartite tricarboxylate transporter substrate binding protein [Burkholderiaceae bacterium]
MKDRRQFINAAGAVMLAGALQPGAAAAQSRYPSKPVRWIVPFPPGSPVDSVARRLGDAVARVLGVAVVVENKPGGGGTIGAAEVARAAPDGYTLLVAIPDPLVSAMAVHKGLRYDPRKDFSFISKISANGPVLVAHPGVSADSFSALVAQAKAQGTEFSYGSWGPGSLPMQLMQSVARQAGVKFQEVTYAGSPPAMQDLLGGRIDMSLTAPHLAAGLIASGKIKALASLGSSRSPLLPTVQTFAEAGFPGFVFTNYIWIGLLGPAGMESAVRDRMAQAVQLALQGPAMRDFLGQNGFMPIGSTPAQFEQEYRTEAEVIPGLIRELGVVPQ